MPLIWLVVIVLVVLAVAGAPSWPYAANWGFGWYPTSGLTLLLIIVLIVLLIR